MPPFARRLARSLASLLLFAALPALAIDESDLLPVELTALHSALAAALVCTIGIGVQVAWRPRIA